MSKINLNCRPFNLRLKYPFGLSRGTTTIAQNVLLTIFFDDFIAYGEAAPSRVYGEDQHSVVEFIKAFVKNRNLDSYLMNINNLKEDLDNFNLSVSRQLRSNIFSYSARAALEMVFWDLIGKIQKRPLCEFFFQANPFVSKNASQILKPTSYTIGIDDLEVIKLKTKEALKNGFSILKVKLGLGLDEDLMILDSVKSVLNGDSVKIRVDANGGWDLETTKKMIDKLPAYNVELIEQPLPQGKVKDLSKLITDSSIPIFVDEDCILSRDVESLAGKVHGVNVKLMKTGSIIEALKLIKLAKSYNLGVMLGCMVESSCAIAAAVHLSPLVDYVDLDGYLLLEKDPFTGLSLEEGKIMPSYGDGLGVIYTEN